MVALGHRFSVLGREPRAESREPSSEEPLQDRAAPALIQRPLQIAERRLLVGPATRLIGRGKELGEMRLQLVRRRELLLLGDPRIERAGQLRGGRPSRWTALEG